MTNRVAAHTRTRIKMCGFTRAQDVQLAAALGVDALGFVCYDKSPRHVSLEQLRSLQAVLPVLVTPVLLFVNASAAAVRAALAVMPQALLQFHGDESAADCAQFDRPWIKAARIGPGFELVEFARQYPRASALLLDAYTPHYGGSGKVFDWSVSTTNVNVPLVLSGGLDAANVAVGLRRFRPWAVDVSSGIEQDKGIKDATRMQAFVAAVRSADAAQAS